VEEGNIERFARVLNCRIIFFPFIYLGMPIGASFGKKETWDPIIAKFSKNSTRGSTSMYHFDTYLSSYLFPLIL